MEALLESRSGLWAGGPAPRQFYRIPPTPGSSVDPASALYGGPITRTQNPMVTWTSVLGLKFEGGVVIAADMLGSYGSLARFRNISRIMRVNNSTMLGASGDYADFQYLKQVLGQMVFLGYVDMLGVAYEAPSLATGYGAYLAQVSSQLRGRRQKVRGLVAVCLFYPLNSDMRNRLCSLLLGLFLVQGL